MSADDVAKINERLQDYGYAALHVAQRGFGAPVTDRAALTDDQRASMVVDALLSGEQDGDKLSRMLLPDDVNKLLDEIV